MDTEEERRALQRKLRQLKQEASGTKRHKTLSTRDTWQHDGDDEVTEGGGDGGAAEAGKGGAGGRGGGRGGGAGSKHGNVGASDSIQAIDFRT